MSKYASFGSISTGTLNPVDVLDAMVSELDYLVQMCPGILDAKGEFGAKRAVKEANRLLADYANTDVDADAIARDVLTDEIADTTQTIDEYLQDFAPPYGYFGAHFGDGADIGFWLPENFSDDFDGLQVADTSEVPDDYSGEVLHVNDHGNATLYVATDGELSEVWSVV